MSRANPLSRCRRNTSAVQYLVVLHELLRHRERRLVGIQGSAQGMAHPAFGAYSIPDDSTLDVEALLGPRPSPECDGTVDSAWCYRCDKHFCADCEEGGDDDTPQEEWICDACFEEQEQAE